MVAVGRYADVLRAPWVARLLGASILARLPIGIGSLAIVLFLREQTGSYAIAGAVAAAFSAGSGLTAPIRARQVDRRGPLLIVPGLVVLYVVGLSALIGGALLDLPAAVLVVLGFVAGSGTPPISSMMRTLWPGLLDDRPALLPAAFALDGVSVELIFVSGPLIVAAVAAVASPQVALGLSCVLVTLGTLAFLRPPPARAWTAPDPEQRAGAGGPFGSLRLPGILTVVLVTIPLGVAFGVCEVALPAFAEEQGHRPLAGLLLAVWASGSAAGGLWYGAQVTERGLPSRYLRGAFGLPVVMAPLAFAPSLVVMLVLLPVAGAFIAPTLTSGTQLVGQLAPEGAATEAYAWPTTAIILGIGGGNAAGGAISDALSAQAALGLGAGVALVGALTLLARMGTLRT